MGGKQSSGRGGDGGVVRAEGGGLKSMFSSLFVCLFVLC